MGKFPEESMDGLNAGNHLKLILLYEFKTSMIERGAQGEREKWNHHISK